MIYFISLSENLARAQAGPKRLNDRVGTSMQCGDPVQEETGLRAPSAQGAAFHTWEAAGPRLDAQGACFQHPRVEWRWAGEGGY